MNRRLTSGEASLLKVLPDQPHQAITYMEAAKLKFGEITRTTKAVASKQIKGLHKKGYLGVIPPEPGKHHYKFWRK